MLVIYHLFDCLPDRVVPMTNGSVQFEYDSNGRDVEIEVKGDNCVILLNGKGEHHNIDLKGMENVLKDYFNTG
ncbi:hypothetical protein J4205_04050 [Candidatus Pacearchaeota archaeon]|nr:hypothetical protein [Candidatus Pacearchaeota archaeon]